MVQVSTLRRRSWAGAAWLTVIVAAMLVALASGNAIAMVAALFAALLSGGLLLGQVTIPVAALPVAGPAAEVARAQRSVLMQDGMPRQALIVHPEAADAYQAVLTIDGYTLVNAEGRAILALSRAASASVNEPVVVTILDAEIIGR